MVEFFKGRWVVVLQGEGVVVEVFRVGSCRVLQREVGYSSSRGGGGSRGLQGREL